LIVETIDYYSRNVDPKKGIYTDFVKQLVPQSDSVITFNWDNLLDQLFSEHYGTTKDSPRYWEAEDIVWYYWNFLQVCTDEKKPIWSHARTREPSWSHLYTKDPYIPDSPWQKSDSTIPFGPHYIKLHGSIDLVYCSNNLCENFLKPLIRKGKFIDENKCGACHEAVKLYIIPPIQNKPIRDMPYIRRSWNKAQELCRAAEQVVFWGYSLPQTDHWSNWLVRQIWNGRCQEIIIINPDCFPKKNGIVDDSFVNRFCPKEEFSGKTIKRSEFKSFKEFIDSTNSEGG
ncbi:MAG: hypothetical protein IID17_00130, partial [Nitrospinae bacterium]|nr:hypothetical protein [Nitrospinota bacterium]